MRSRIEISFDNRQPKIGQIDISEIKLDHHSRDQIPQILLGLQSIYKDKAILEQVLDLLENEIITQRGIRGDLGRPGMNLWQILVCGVLRLNNGWDYDHLENMVNSHREIRQMLGLTFWDEEQRFTRKTLNNNLSQVPDSVSGNRI